MSLQFRAVLLISFLLLKMLAVLLTYTDAYYCAVVDDGLENVRNGPARPTKCAILHIRDVLRVVEDFNSMLVKNSLSI